MGYLLFLRDENLLAQRLDENRMQMTGEPVAVAEQVGTSITRAFFSVSANGTLAYRGADTPNTELNWYDRQGHLLGDAGEPGQYYQDVALFGDGSKIAYDQASAGGNRQVWILETARRSNTRLTFLPDGARLPVWSPDGTHVAFSSIRGSALYVRDVANSGVDRPLIKSGGIKFVTDWSRDGRFLLYTETRTSLDLFALAGPLGDADRKGFPVADSGFNEMQGRFSPDSRWVAYASDETGRYEIYVRPFPPGNGRSGQSLVSSGGGSQPRWRADGKELYYLQPIRS
jgi:Tol biopolymer transport system component